VKLWLVPAADAAAAAHVSLTLSRSISEDRRRSANAFLKSQAEMMEFGCLTLALLLLKNGDYE
jgi:hypothetical protein